MLQNWNHRTREGLFSERFTENPSRQLEQIPFQYLTARPTDVADLLQTCLNSVSNPSEVNGSGGPDCYANMGVNKGIRSFAAATMYSGVMIVTYWAQPNAPILDPSPATAMTDRAIPKNATRAIEVYVHHALYLLVESTDTFVKFAFIPRTEWRAVGGGTWP